MTGAAEAGDRTQDAIRDTGFGDESTAPLMVGCTAATAALEPTPAALRSLPCTLFLLAFLLPPEWNGCHNLDFFPMIQCSRSFPETSL